MKTKLFFSTVALTLIFTSCIKDKNKKSYTIYRPEFSIKQTVKDNAHLHPAIALKDLGSFVLYNNTMYVNEKNKGIHIIDYSNANNPVNKGFIPIPGNVGIAIKDNIMYADCYSDLLVFSIQTNENIQLINSIPNTFLSRVTNTPIDSTVIQVTWIAKDTTVSEWYYNYYLKNNTDKRNQVTYATATINSNSGAGNSVTPPTSGGVSVGSSLAVFAIINDYLYTVDKRKLNTFSLVSASNPVLENSQTVNSDVETIYPFKDKLFIGSMTGMFAYGLENPANPNYLSQFNHARVCDPVIADDNYAFVTLSNGSRCGGSTNQMDVLNIEDIENPKLIKTFTYTNPHGLSKDGNILFLCDGKAGLRVLDASDVSGISTKQTLAIGNALDVVALNQKAFVMLETGIKIYSYNQQFNITYLGGLNK